MLTRKLPRDRISSDHTSIIQDTRFSSGQNSSRLEPLGSAAAMAAMADAALEANLLLAVPSAAAVRVRRATGTTAAGLLVGVDVAERVRRPARHDVLEPLHPLDGPRRRHVTQMPPVICAIRMTLRLLLLLKLLGRGRRIPAALLKQRVSLVVLDVVRRAQLRLALRGRLDHRKVFPRTSETESREDKNWRKEKQRKKAST